MLIVGCVIDFFCFSVIYNFLITVYNLIVGLITSETLVTIAFGAFGVYLVWICGALFCYENDNA